MQDPGERRTVDELLTFYSLHPDIRDVFVEGRSDKAFLDWHFSGVPGSDLVGFYAVSDRVNLDDSAVIGSGYLAGERGRVLSLASLLETAIPGHESARFVVDRDFFALGADECPEIDGVVYTDYSSMEMYAYNERAIEKVLRVALGAPKSITARDLMAEINPILIALFISRLCLRESGTGASVSERMLTKWKIEEPNRQIVSEIFRVSLNQVSKSQLGGVTVDMLMSAYERHSTGLVEDPRHYINGHDVSFLMVRYLKAKCGNVFNSDGRRAMQAPAALEIVLMSSIEGNDFATSNLALSLTEWMEKVNESAFEGP